MTVLFSHKDDVLIAIPDGRLDTNNAPEAEDALVGHIEKGALKIVMDFAKTKYISSAGLRVILKSAKMLKKNGGAIVLCNANEQIHEVLEISGFLTMLDCLASLEEAIQKLSE